MEIIIIIFLLVEYADLKKFTEKINKLKYFNFLKKKMKK
jgi:hypothetical protein